MKYKVTLTLTPITSLSGPEVIDIWGTFDSEEDSWSVHQSKFGTSLSIDIQDVNTSALAEMAAMVKK